MNLHLNVLAYQSWSCGPNSSPNTQKKRDKKGGLIGAHPYIQERSDSPAASEALDQLMWRYPENHFVPHGVGSDAKNSAFTLIGDDEPPPSTDQVLINIADDVPSFFGRYERVVEVVVQPERELGRDRYRHYRDRGYPLHYHELDDWEKQ